MKIEANDKEVQDIFSLGYFQIPRFQRPYSWGVDEVQSFWDDVILENPENYFIGSMVVYQSKKPCFGIVDGQQRLTTITLILSAIRNAFIAIGEDNLAKGVHKYIEKPNIDNEDEFVLKSETSFPYLQDHIQSFDGYNLICEAGIEEKNLEFAFNLIESNLLECIPGLKKISEVQSELFTNNEKASVQALKIIRDKVLSLKLVFIQLESEDEAYLIFETLNARGRDLTTSDLVKNLILKKIKSTSVSIDQAKESWNGVVRNFDDSSDTSTLDSFLLHYWVSEYKYTTDKKLFSEIKSYINDDSQAAKQLIKKLSSIAPYYNSLLFPDFSSWSKEEAEIKESLKALNVFKVKQQTAMTLSLLRAYREKRISIKNMKVSLSKIELFHYCFNAVTSQRSSGTIAANYSKLAIQLTEASTNDDVQKIFNELDKFLASKIPSEDEFVVKFMDLCYASNRTKYKGIVKYTLSKLVPTDSGALPLDLESSTIEHVLPESDESLNLDVISNIGNLILVDKKANSEELRDKSYLDKYAYLRSKNYPLREVFLEEAIFDERTILKRGENIATHMYKNICRVIV